MQNFNNTHPERQDGERWLCNIRCAKDLYSIYRAKRVGRRAYNHKGERMIDCYPVFVRKEVL